MNLNLNPVVLEANKTNYSKVQFKGKQQVVNNSLSKIKPGLDKEHTSKYGKMSLFTTLGMAVTAIISMVKGKFTSEVKDNDKTDIIIPDNSMINEISDIEAEYYSNGKPRRIVKYPIPSVSVPDQIVESYNKEGTIASRIEIFEDRGKFKKFDGPYEINGQKLDKNVPFIMHVTKYDSEGKIVKEKFINDAFGTINMEYKYNEDNSYDVYVKKSGISVKSGCHYKLNGVIKYDSNGTEIYRISNSERDVFDWITW